MMKGLLIFIFAFCLFQVEAQGLTWLSQHPTVAFDYEQGVRKHYSLKPYHHIKEDSSTTISLYALPDIAYFSNNREQVRTMAGGAISFNHKSKFVLRGSYVGGVETNNGFYPVQSNNRNEKPSLSTVADPRIMLSYKPNRTITLAAGYDELFLGEGSRSLLLSDYGNPYPFAMTRLNFWRFEYSNIYQFFHETINGKRTPKYGTSHHLSTNITKWFNIGVFETVLFQSKDTLLNRGYEFEYLNPMIFFRPQEYALGSIDNILIGLDGTISIGKNVKLYGQVLIDEFSLSAIRARNGWWANKYAIQAGMKGRMKQKNGGEFFYRGEINVVRPFTYSHLSKQLSYSHNGKSLAHPYGSNFAEMMIHLSEKIGKLQIDMWGSYSMKGFSSDSINLGDDVLRPYIDRADDFGHFIGQGQTNHAWRQQLRFTYAFLPSKKLRAFAEFHWRLNTTVSEPVGQIVIGMRHSLWNDYRNF